MTVGAVHVAPYGRTACLQQMQLLVLCNAKVIKLGAQGWR